MASSVPIQIEPVPLVSRSAALRFLLEQVGPLEQYQVEPDHEAWLIPCPGEFLIWARRGDRILSVFWGVPTARGRSLQVTLPRCDAEAPAELLEQMLRDLLVRMQEDRNARLAQTLIEPGASELQGRARRIGFQHVANLAWYTCVPPLSLERTVDVRLVRYESAARAQLLAVLERTYENSSDCPSLAGLLEPADYLAEYELRHADSERAWYFVRSGDKTIGCLLCGLAKGGLVELTYWGLIPEARGRRLGGHVLHLMNREVAHSAKFMVACADEENLAACRALQRMGFAVSNRQQLYICPLTTGGSVSGAEAQRKR